MKPGQKFELGGKTAYQQWVESQGVPVIRDFYIADLRKVELAPWPWKGGRGAIMNLIGTGDINDSYLVEIPPSGSLKPQRLLFEETYFVVAGSGSTSVWNDEKKKVTFEWQAGSLFSPPINTWRQHFNGSGSQPARLFAVTSAPPLFNLFRDTNFIVNNSHAFANRFDGEADAFSGEGETFQRRGRHIWDTNFVADIRNLELYALERRGAGGKNIQIALAENCMGVHISEFPVGTYKKAHRHGPGAHVVIIGGQGYSLMWPEGEPIKRFDWKDGSVVVPPDRWFHQHFNTGSTPARYLALRAGGGKYARPWGNKDYTGD